MEATLTDAQVRAAYMKGIVRGLATHPAAEEIRAACGPALERIETSSGLAWLPFETNYAFTLAAHRALGTEGLTDYYRGAFLAVWDSPLLNSLTEFALRVGGNNPGRLLRFFRRGYPNLFRGVGQWSAPELGPQRASILLSGFPERCLEHDAMWLHSVRGSVASFLDFTDHEGTVSMEIDDAGAFARFEFRWTTRD